MEMNMGFSSSFQTTYPHRQPSVVTKPKASSIFRIVVGKPNPKQKQKPQPRSNRHFIVNNHSPASSFPHNLIKHAAKRFNNAPSLFIQGAALSSIFNMIDDFICTFLDLPLRPCIDPAHVLAGNFAPVDELPPTTCEVVKGTLPSCLHGAYIRNGPNPQFIPKGPYHYFDGDGMLHMIKISQGNVTFCSRYVKTHKYLMEHKIGYPFVPSVFASFNGIPATIIRLILILARVVAGQFDPLNHGLGVANTSLALISHRLFALCESDVPYQVKPTFDGDIVTLGRDNFSRKEPLLRMTAHPKFDQETGETFAFEHNTTPPFLTFFRIDSKGQKQTGLPMYSMKQITGIHDFAITKSYIIFPDMQIVVNPWQILKGKSPVEVDRLKVPRLGIIPKQARDESQMWWIDVPGFNMLHCFNAWEEDDGNTIVVIATNVASVEQMLEEIQSSQLMLEKITINVKTKMLHRSLLSTTSLDFAVINPAYATRKTRYVYASVIGQASWEGIVKLDLSLTNTNTNYTNGCSSSYDCIVATRIYGEGYCGGEPFFVAREPNNLAADEDDGYLVTYIHDENKDESRFLVMDAKSPTLDIVAAVKLPRRVPNGMHGLFLSQADLNTIMH